MFARSCKRGITHTTQRRQRNATYAAVSCHHGWGPGPFEILSSWKIMFA